MTDRAIELEWHRVAAVNDLPEGRVMTVTAGIRSMALTHVRGRFSAMENRCPHQGGHPGF
jgi:nitrite reductase/ring-hydroxylating ferredoxin subunit